MEPYYYKNNIWLYHANSIDFMESMPENVIDLTVTSPPYDNLRKYKDGAGDNWCEDVWKKVIEGLWKVTKDGGVIVWIVNDSTVKGSETGSSFKQALYFKEVGFNLHDTMIYQFAGTGAKGSKLCYWQGFEYMFIFSKGRPKSINRIKDHENITKGSIRGHIGKFANGTRKERGIRTTPAYSVRTNVWRYGGTVGDKTKHPAQFPEKLAKDHIISWSNEGDLIFDPFSGSGTTAKMARETNRLFCGSEISKEYCDLSIERLESN